MVCSSGRRVLFRDLSGTLVGDESATIVEVHSKLPVAPWKPFMACLYSHFMTRAAS
jgi:hypothetical protein